MSNFYTKKELNKLGFKKIGKNVEISKKCSFYNIKGSLGKNIRIDDYSIFTGNILIGDFVHISQFVRIIAGNKNFIKIGNFTGIGAYVTITSVSEDFMKNSISNPQTKKLRKTVNANIIIQENSKIGLRSTIIPSTKSGKNIIIGKNSSLTFNTVIKKNISANSIIYNPNAFTLNEFRLYDEKKFISNKKKIEKWYLKKI